MTCTATGTRVMRLGGGRGCLQRLRVLPLLTPTSIVPGAGALPLSPPGPQPSGGAVQRLGCTAQGSGRAAAMQRDVTLYAYLMSSEPNSCAACKRRQMIGGAAPCHVNPTPNATRWQGAGRAVAAVAPVACLFHGASLTAVGKKCSRRGAKAHLPAPPTAVPGWRRDAKAAATQGGASAIGLFLAPCPARDHRPAAPDSLSARRKTDPRSSLPSTSRGAERAKLGRQR